MKWKLAGTVLVAYLAVSVFVASGQGPSGQLDGSPVTCDGGLYDTHAHWEHEDAGGAFAARMDEYNVSCTVLFAPMGDLYERPDHVRSELATEEGGFTLFIQTQDAAFLTEDWLDRVYEGNERFIDGIGEVVFYTGPMQGASLTEAPWPSVFWYAGEHDLPVMLHPVEGQLGEVETMLARYPNTTVVLHGGELAGTGEVPRLLREHENMYWQVDVATLFSGRPLRQEDPDEFVQWYEANREERLDNARQRVVTVMDAAPDRVLWGTDVGGHAWSVEPEVYGRIITFSHDLVASLPEAYQDRYAYGNAQRLFGNATQLSAPEQEVESITELPVQVTTLIGQTILMAGQQVVPGS